MPHGDKPLPWYKDADATRLVVGFGYLIVLAFVIVFVALLWDTTPQDAKSVILPVIGAVTAAGFYALKAMAGDPSTKERDWKDKFNKQEGKISFLETELEIEKGKRESLEVIVNDLHRMIISRTNLTSKGA